MIAALSAFLVLLAVGPTHEQDSQGSTLISPCPNVFMYEQNGTEPGRWYGSIHLSSDVTLHSVWLNILLDSKADLIGNWLGPITTLDNMYFRIEPDKVKITPDIVAVVRFFVKYDPVTEPPRLQAVRLNGKEICNFKPNSDMGQELPKAFTNVKLPDTSSLSTTSTKRPPTEIGPQNIPLPKQSQQLPTESVSPVFVRPVNSPNPTSISGNDDIVAGSRPLIINPSSSPASNPVNNYDSNNRFGQNIGGVKLEGDQRGNIIIFVSRTGSNEVTIEDIENQAKLRKMIRRILAAAGINDVTQKMMSYHRNKVLQIVRC